jgi:acyl-CoA reductase-like NAD-dependent aldehyde dehydrogenase
MKAYKMYIDGKWVDAKGGKTFQDFNPYTGEVFATAAAGGKEDAKLAIDAAAAAFPVWSQTPPSERRMFLMKAANVIEKRKDELGTILKQESGAAFPFSFVQPMAAVAMIQVAASLIVEMTGEILPSDFPGARNMIVRQPVGVVAGISPWNAPFILAIRSIVFPLAFGNTIIAKPSMETPISGGLFIAEIMEEIGLPKGVFNVVTNGPGASGEIGDEFISNPKVKRINFTGSTAVGKQLAEKAGKYLKRITFELGGSDPFIVLKDADVDTAANAAIFGRFIHQGQICMSSKRFIIERPVAEEFTKKFVEHAARLKVGDPGKDDTVIGPLINKYQLDLLKGQVEDAVKKGAKVMCGGKAEGLCYYPTVLTNVTRDMRVYNEETFGPVAPVIVVDSAEEAIEIANGSPFGLSAGIFTGNMEKGMEMAEKIESGMVHINEASFLDEPHCPFGGVKDSGYGKSSGRAVLDEYTELKWVSYQKTPKQYPI